jgi:cytochrome b involved in lipid metabolism
MKRELYIGAFSIVLLIGAVLFFNSKYEQIEKTLLPSADTNITNTLNAQTSGSGTILLGAETVAKHGQASDCWIIISGKVYSVTKYLPIHPGGSGEITPYCGKDATTAFATKGGKGSHSQSAAQALSSFYVGDLGASVNTQNIINLEKVPTPIPVQKGDDYEDN